MVFPEKFFESEIRNEFLIPEIMKRAWAAAVEVLEVVDKICKKHNLTWFSDGGTLLGTIRHQGFIPWDDDIDIAMLRQDYNKLIRILPKELPEGFSLAGMYSDERRLQDAAKVQQLRVIADEKYWNIASYMNRFHSFPCFRIGIDIFPLDYVYNDNDKDKDIVNLYTEMMNILTHWSEYCDHERLKQKIAFLEQKTNERIIIDDDLYNRLWRLSETLIAEIPEKESNCVTNYFYRSYYMSNGKGKYLIDKDAYSMAINKPFEFFEMPVPNGYDNVLKVLYGDYMKMVKTYDGHTYPFYQKQLEEFEKLLEDSDIHISVEEFCNNWEKIK